MTQETPPTPAGDPAAVAIDAAAPTAQPLATPPPAAPQGELAPAPGMAARLGAEALGTFLLIFVGVGAVLYSTVFDLGQLGIALAFGLALVAGVAAVGHVSGGHFNPAVTLGLALAGRHSWRDVLPYWVVQAVSGIVATLVLFVALPQKFLHIGDTAAVRDDLFRSASNGFGTHGPAYSDVSQSLIDNYVQGGATHEQIIEAVKQGQITVPGSIEFTWGAALLIEIVATALFVGVILAVTDKRSPVKFQAVIIGLTLGIAVLVAMPVTNSSINPARALASAVWAGGWTWGQLWVFIVGPLVGGAVAALFYRGFAAPRSVRRLAFATGTPGEGEFFQDASAQPLATPEAATDEAASSPNDAGVLSHGVTGEEQPAGADDATVLSEGQQEAPIASPGDASANAEPADDGNTNDAHGDDSDAPDSTGGGGVAGTPDTAGAGSQDGDEDESTARPIPPAGI